jgi:hypothetical protein
VSTFFCRLDSWDEDEGWELVEVDAPPGADMIEAAAAACIEKFDPDGSENLIIYHVVEERHEFALTRKVVGVRK